MKWPRWLETVGERLSGWYASWGLWRRLSWGLLFFFVLFGLFFSTFQQQTLDLEAGDVVSRNIPAPREFVDRPATERLRDQAAASVPRALDQDPAVTDSVITELESVFDELAGLRQQLTADNLQNQVNQARSILLLDIPSEVIVSVLQADAATFQQLRSETLTLTEQVLATGIQVEELPSTRDTIRSEVEGMGLSEPHKTFVAELAADRIRANEFVNQEETERRRQEAREEVEPVTFSPGQFIVREGERLTEEDIIHLQDAGLLATSPGPARSWGAVLLALLLTVLAAGYLYRDQRDILEDRSQLTLLVLIMTITLILSRAIMTISPYLIPMAAGAMLIAIMINVRTAIFMTVVMSAATGVFTGLDLGTLFVGLVGGFTGIFAVSDVGQRSDLMRAGLWVGLANAAAIGSLTLVQQTPFILSESQLWWNLVWGVLNGVISAVLTIGTLPFLESLFGVVTAVKLLELSNPNHKLLRRLLVEAPGTYHHSIMVANLAEAAAEAVGGNALLARVGAYYHDIGKLSRPYFFVENQVGDGEDPHAKLAPNLSALIVTSHVKDGLALARKHQLPGPIKDFIREHHGRTRTGFFYSQATEDAGDDKVLEENFRYDGPRPRTKETAVVMLADVAEAATRALSKPTPDRIEARVRELIRRRMTEGELDKSNLTFRDLDRITETFVQILSGIFHQRIEYPEGVPDEVVQELPDPLRRGLDDEGKGDEGEDSRPLSGSGV